MAAAALIIVMIVGIIALLGAFAAAAGSVQRKVLDAPAPDVAPGVRFPYEARLVEAPRLLIRYVDFDGRATQREITPKVLAGPSKRSPDRVLAYCHARKAPREFVLSRIKAAADAETGEVLPSVRMHLKGRIKG